MLMQTFRVQHHMHQNLKILGWYLMLAMLPIDTDTVVDCSPVVIGHPPHSISLAPIYIWARAALFVSFIYWQSQGYMVTNHASQERLPVFFLWALEFQACHPILWSKPRMELDHDSSCRWWKFSSLQLESKTVHGSMQRVSGEPLYKRNPIR